LGQTRYWNENSSQRKADAGKNTRKFARGVFESVGFLKRGPSGRSFPRNKGVGKKKRKVGPRESRRSRYLHKRNWASAPMRMPEEFTRPEKTKRFKGGTSPQALKDRCTGKKSSILAVGRKRKKKKVTTNRGSQKGTKKPQGGTRRMNRTTKSVIKQCKEATRSITRDMERSLRV